MATYYISPTGNDQNPGTSEASPWLTVARVNAATFAYGDFVLFQRGGTWRETLTVPTITGTGSPTNVLTFGAYGTGQNPILSGADLWTSWTAVVGQSYYYSTSYSVAPIGVYQDNTLLTQAASRTFFCSER